MPNKFQRITYSTDLCPWCGKQGIRVSAMKHSIIRYCSNRCGYKAPIPKKLLTFSQKIKYYDPKRYRRETPRLELYAIIPYASDALHLG